MHLIDALPNLLIGLREGLEAGLVITLLLAALRKAGRNGGRAAFPIWLGVLGAVSVAASFAAVITYSSTTPRHATARRGNGRELWRAPDLGSIRRGLGQQ